MKESDEYQELKELCHKLGYRCTPQRAAVYSYVKGNLTHPNVNTIWEAVRKTIPSITRESVFRILMEFADNGIINRMDKVTDARFDGQTKNHGHLICNKCGKIIDFELPVKIEVPESIAGFMINHTELRVSGLCQKCSKKKAGTTKDTKNTKNTK